MQHVWHDFYRGAEEPTPEDAPEPRGSIVTTHCLVDGKTNNLADVLTKLLLQAMKDFL